MSISDPAFAPAPEQLQQVFDSDTSISFQQKEMRVHGENNEGLDRFILSWLELPSRHFRYDLVFRAIGNSDHGLSHSLSSSVYFLNRRTDTIFHMYDDRGLDVIAKDEASLSALYRSYNAWILDYDRKRIDAIFRGN